MPGLPITGSPDITNLNFNVLYDISGGVPTIVLTNTSIGNPSGTTNLANCTWWYEITDPNGTYIHQGSVGTPDVTAANWTTLTLPTGAWPTPFGIPPYGQIVFSCSLPYRTTLYVKDSANNIYSITKATTICRPNGSTEKTWGNFGVAEAFAETKCNIAKIYATDKTNYTYQNRLGSASSSTWKLAYPMDAEGNDPEVVTVEDRATVIFPVGYSAKGYQLNLSTFATYDMGDGASIKIQYKFDKVFAVYCNVDLCQLVCEIDKLYKLLPSKCGTVENTEVKDKLLRINTLLGQCFIGINQPLCGIDVPSLIEEIKKIGGFTCNCGVGGGINAIGVTDGDITLTAVTSGAITAAFTNIGNNYTLTLAVPGSAAGTLQDVTDNGNTTTNDIIVGDPSGAHTTIEDFRITLDKSGTSALVAGIGLTNPAQTSGKVWVGTVGQGQFYVEANPLQVSYAVVAPANQGGAGTTLVNDGAGNLSWAAGPASSLQAVTDVGYVTTNPLKIVNNAMIFSRSTAFEGFLYPVTGITANRIWVLKDESGTIPTIENANTWSGIQTFESGDLKLQGSTSGDLSISAADATTTHAIKMPATQGSANTFLKNDGAGNLSWASPSVLLSVQHITADADFTISTVNSFVNLQAVLSANRVITMPPAANGGIVKIVAFETATPSPYAWQINLTPTVVDMNGQGDTPMVLVDGNSYEFVYNATIGRWVVTQRTDVVKKVYSRSVGPALLASMTLGTGAGTGASSTFGGNSVAGQISILTGTGCAGNATLATITYGSDFKSGTKPAVILTPANASTADASFAGPNVYVDYTDSDDTKFVIKTTAALTDSLAYRWQYHVISITA